MYELQTLKYFVHVSLWLYTIQFSFSFLHVCGAGTVGQVYIGVQALALYDHVTTWK